jgi:hypothetical protein
MKIYNSHLWRKVALLKLQYCFDGPVDFILDE